jgi:hypothetical protein
VWVGTVTACRIRFQIPDPSVQDPPTNAPPASFSSSGAPLPPPKEARRERRGREHHTHLQRRVVRLQAQPQRAGELPEQVHGSLAVVRHGRARRLLQRGQQPVPRQLQHGDLRHHIGQRRDGAQQCTRFGTRQALEHCGLRRLLFGRAQLAPSRGDARRQAHRCKLLYPLRLRSPSAPGSDALGPACEGSRSACGRHLRTAGAVAGAGACSESHMDCVTRLCGRVRGVWVARTRSDRRERFTCLRGVLQPREQRHDETRVIAE